MDFSQVKSWTIPEGAVKRAWIGGQLVWQSETPKPYDAEIQWLRNNGDCSLNNPNYIALWRVPSFSSRWEIRYQFNDISNYCYIGTGQSRRFMRVGVTDDGRFNLQLTNKTVYSAPSDIMPHTFVLDALGGRILIDGVALYEGALGTLMAQYAPTVFNSMVGANPATDGFAERPSTFYWSRWYEDGVLVEDVIPVRIGQAGYLYDKVSGELHGLQGDGTLTLGPDVSA